MLRIGIDLHNLAVFKPTAAGAYVETTILPLCHGEAGCLLTSETDGEHKKAKLWTTKEKLQGNLLANLRETLGELTCRETLGKPWGS